MAADQTSLLFIPFANNTETRRRDDKRKNRHVQVQASRNQMRPNHGHEAVLRVQMKFKSAGSRIGPPKNGGCKCQASDSSGNGRVCIKCYRQLGTKATNDVPTSQQSSELHMALSAQTLHAPCQVSCGVANCPGDARSLHYFINFAALDLSGYLASDFWTKLVLQAAQFAPMVKYAVFAVGMAHFDHCTGYPTSRMSKVSYQVALKHLRRFMVDSENPSSELVLLCCILLFTFDRLSGDTESASIHVRSAFAILANAQKKRSGCRGYRWTPSGHDGGSELSALTSMLLLMDIEDTMPALDRGPLLRLEPSETAVHWDPPPARFVFCNAGDILDPWMHISHSIWEFIGRNAAYRHVPVDKVPHRVVMERKQLFLWIKAWRAGVKQWFERHPIPCLAIVNGYNPNLSHHLVERLNVLTLEIHYFSVKALLVECLDDEDRPHPFDLTAEKVLRSSEQALSLRQAHQRVNSLSIGKTFSTHIGIAESLLCLCHRTTSPAVRERAQRIIRGFHEISGEFSGVVDFFAGCGAPPKDMILIYELPGH